MLNGHGDDLYKYNDIKINFSSNVYSHFDHSGLFAHLAECLPKVVNYPDPTPVTLEAALAEQWHIKPSQVMVTNGATEAIYLIAHAFRGSTSAIVGPTFSEYADACRLNEHRLLDDECGTNDAEARLTWICNPNNPTGSVLAKGQLERMIRQKAERQQYVVIDASYAPFTSESVPTAAEGVRFGNTLMLHSMTKEYAIPGLRLGCVTGDEVLLGKVKRCRMPWSVNRVAQDAGLYLLQHKDDYALDVMALMDERRRVADALGALPRIEVCPSDTHILLCKISGGSASHLKDYLACRHGMLIRDASNFEGLTAGHFRIAIQTREENDALIKAIAQYEKETSQQACGE